MNLAKNKLRHVIIGGSGFLGLALVKRLLEEPSVSIIVADINEIVDPDLQRQVEFVKVDIADLRSIAKLELLPGDVVHHLASRLIVPNCPRFRRYDYFARTSVQGTKNLLVKMKDSKVSRLVFWSTDMVYGIQNGLLIDENATPKPIGPYGETKLIAEQLVIQARKNWLARATIFRPRLISGEGRLGILEKLFRLVEGGKIIPLIGDGSSRFQFISVEDCAEASVAASKMDCPNEIFNLGSDDPVTIHELLTDLVEKNGSSSKILKTNARLVRAILDVLNIFRIAPMDPEQYRIAAREMVLSTGKAKAILGWQPHHNDSEIMIAAYRSYISTKSSM